MEKICVLGLGYIGLPTALMLALNNYDVIGVDLNDELIKNISERQLNIVEPCIKELLGLVLMKKKLSLRTVPQEADVFIITVQTPLKPDHTCDLSYLISAVKSILPYIKSNDLIIIESTIPPGTTLNLVKPIIEERFTIGEDVYLAYCPERVLPSKIINEMIYNDRIIGACTNKCGEKVKKIFSSYIKGELFITDVKTAEMAKLMENTFRDVNIALANEFTKICNKLNINAIEAINLANKHPRVNIHKPGPGVGGHCIPIDPYFIIEKAPELARIISVARETNDNMPYYIVSKIKRIVMKVNNPKVAVLGVAYKGNVNDTRESPALKIIELLKAEGIKVEIYDPYVNLENANEKRIEAVAAEADMILILTGHDDFKKIDYEKLSSQTKPIIIFDTKNIIQHKSKNENIRNLGNYFDD
ncbi:nucleotide sugar dehydrogenase [Wukongibacter sp. M2B1]|uniref:nucleotide sugar dehydrogenase n=1 Tax=Wukongibacter sp. M2B1 TaxID=3088895 RepID=UPI003D7A512B